MPNNRKRRPDLPAPTMTLPPIAWRLVAYLRVSGREQVRHHGLTVQEAEVRAWAIDQGYRVMRIHQDAASAGGDAAVRPGLVDALEEVKAGRVGGVVVQRLDRIARDLVAQEAFISEVRRAGGRVFSASPTESQLLGEDPGDPARTLVRQFMGAVSQYERALTRLRLEAGKERKRAQGGRTDGRPPIGYRAQGGGLVADAREQSAIARALELRSVGHSYRDIAGILGHEGYRTRAGGLEWHPETVRRMCRRHFQPVADGEPGPWNGYDLGAPDPEWTTNPGAIPSGDKS
jgi:DNA invertase Pin-like site-specific DNA recombinase